MEATAFGQRRIISDLIQHGVKIEKIIAVGGIAQKSDYVMQTLSNVLQFPVSVSSVNQACAYGAAIYAAVAAGFFGSIEEAQAKICRPCVKTFYPDSSRAAFYHEKYHAYCRLAGQMDPIMQTASLSEL